MASSLMRTALPLFVAASFVNACLPPGIHDPRAVPPEYDRWEARVAAAPSVTFARTMTLLADSGYTARHADAAAGIIATNLRRARVGSGVGEFRLDLMLLPQGEDTTRVVITGEFCHIYEGAQRCYRQTAYSPAEWAVVQGIGEALLMRSLFN